MEAGDLLRYTTGVLERLGLPYLVTGSVATILFGEPRFTNRAVRVEPGPDFEASFATAEDVILKKMEYYRDGGGDRHLRDIAGVLRISGDRIDRDYIRRWAEELGVEEVWTAVVDELPENP